MSLPPPRPPPQVFTGQAELYCFRSVGLEALLPFPLEPFKSVVSGLTAPWLHEDA